MTLAKADRVAIPNDGENAHLSDVLDTFAQTIVGEHVPLGAIAAFTGRRSIGALLLILALPMAVPVPAPGLSVIFGIPLILVSAQLVLQRRAAWLPARLAARTVARADLVAFIAMALPRLRALERIVKPRMTWMAADWAMIPVGAVCVILAVVIALPIPLGHMVPGTAISVLALGLAERDGLAIALGLVIAVLGVAIVSVASLGAIAMARAWFGAI
jgi:hypothetical protein